MSRTKIPYQSLPDPVHAAIEQQIGAVTTVSSIGTGLNSSVAVLLRTSQGRFFVKALPAQHRWVWTQQREADIAAYVRALAPALIAHLVEADWNVVIFEALDGTTANYTPASPDLPAVAQVLDQLGQLPCPPIEMREAPLRLKAYAEDSELHHFAGNALLHTDLNSANIIVNNSRARLVDWGWATRGAPWLDPAYWVIWLIAAGHHPTDAEDLATTIPSWHRAPVEGVNAFAAANARLWKTIAGTEPDSFTAPVAEAAQRWHHYRHTTRR